MLRLRLPFGRSGPPLEEGDGTRPLSDRATSDIRPGCMALFFSVFLLAGLGFFIPFFLLPVVKILEARFWAEVPCTILESRVETHSGDDGPTYSVEVRYSYELDGRSYTGDRYHFLSGSTSGYEGKADAVARLPAGTRVTCWVDPDDPAEAVVHRGFSWELLFGLFPLIFVAVGAGGIAFTLATARAQRSASAKKSPWRLRPPPRAAEITELETGSFVTGSFEEALSGPVALEPAAGPVAKLAGIVFVALFWNGIVSVFVWQLIRGWQAGHLDGCLAVFLIPFILVGLLLLAGVPYQFLALFNPRPRLTLSRGAIPRGESAQVTWRFSGAAGRLRSLRLTVEGQEEAKYTRGTDTHTDREIFATVEVVHLPRGGGLAAGSAEIVIPTDTMPSFEAPRNKINWKLKLRGEIRWWPDVIEEFPLTVLPESPESRPPLPPPARPLPRAGSTEAWIEMERDTFAPGNEVAGTAHWRLSEPPEAVELHLLWYTEGKGDQDVRVVRTLELEDPGSEGEREFSFRLPESPYSFSGSLISLSWAVELVIEPDQELARQVIVVSPTGGEVVLPVGEGGSVPAAFDPGVPSWLQRILRRSS